jgi:ATP-binding cassette subfamily B protein
VWVLSHVGRSPGLIAVFVASTVVAHLLSTLVPVYAGRAFDEATSPNPALSTMAGIAGVMVLLAAGRFGGDLLSNGSMEVVAQRVKRDTRDELFRSLLAKRQSFHDRQHVGDILARAINDARLVDYMLSPGLSTAFNGIVAVLVPLVFIASLRGDLLLAPGVLIAVFSLALWHHLRRLHPRSHRLRLRFAELNETFAETLEGMATVKASTQEDAERAKFDERARRYRDAFVDRGRTQSVYLPALSFGLGMAIGAVHSLLLLGKGELALPEVVTYLGWLALFAMPISLSEQSVPVIQEGYIAAGRMQQMIERDHHERETQGGSTAPIDGHIAFEDVSFARGGAQVLRDVSFDLPAGQTLAIVGTTGSGKSTVTKLVNRTYDAGQGRVLIDGSDVREWDPGALRRQIGNVHQDAFLFSRSVAENIAFGSLEPVSREQIIRAAEQAHADGFIREMEDGYDTVLEEGGKNLSGGQRQRLVIARALLADPRILVLDDATSAVDAETEHAITEAIATLMRGRTTVLVSHRPSQIRRADQILLIDAGEVVDNGTHDELMSRCPLYREIYAD